MISFSLRKALLVLAAFGIAGAFTVLPWFLLFQVVPDSLSNFWGMTAILWAPLALVVGIAAGCLFVLKLWPRDTVTEAGNSL